MSKMFDKNLIFVLNYKVQIHKINLKVNKYK